MLVVVRTVLQDLAVGRDKLEVAECPGDCCEGTGLVGSSLSTINNAKLGSRALKPGCNA